MSTQAQQDWVGSEPQELFRDIRNTRPSTAEEKAVQLMRLGEMVTKIPEHIKSGGTVGEVRSWKKDRDAAAKVAGNSRASINDITASIHNMERWWR